MGFVDGYGEENPNRVAECAHWIVGTKRRITIDRNTWIYMNEVYKKEVVAHELTHCFFGQGHVENSDHFMYYSIVHFYSEAQLEQQITDYLKDKCDAS